MCMAQCCRIPKNLYLWLGCTNKLNRKDALRLKHRSNFKSGCLFFSLALSLANAEFFFSNMKCLSYELTVGPQIKQKKSYLERN